jgi:hypothetical protein
MRRLRFLALFLCVSAVSASDSLRTADTLSIVHSDSLLSLDSVLAHGDTLPVHPTLTSSWLLPVAVIVVSLTAFWTLFTARSR